MESFIESQPWKEMEEGVKCIKGFSMENNWGEKVQSQNENA